MAVIAIIGAAGVGKSTLVKQLAALRCCPAFFEGEEGVFPPVVTEGLLAANVESREQWFARQYQNSLIQARQIVALGADVIVDNASYITVLSYATAAGDAEQPGISHLVADLREVAADLTIVLTASEAVLTANIIARGRRAEAESLAIAGQAVRVQAEFLRLAALDPRCLILDRSALDFNLRNDLERIDAQIRAFALSGHV